MKKFTQSALVALSLGVSQFALAAEAPVWQFMSTGSEQTYAIKTDGTLWAWGSALYGELGNGAKKPEKVSTPTQIGTDTNWKFAAGGSARAFFIKEDGTMWSVGTAEGGVLGTNSSAAQTTPVQIGTDTDWKFVATSNAGDNYDAMAIKEDGTLWGWGKNELGTLGLGNFSAKAVPTQVGTDNDWVTVTIGRNHTLAMKADGSIWGCGEANNGALGNNSGFKKEMVLVAEAADWAKIYAIDNASYAIKKDGTLWAWGENSRDILGLQLTDGDNTVETVSEPAQVTAVTETVLAMSGGQYNRVIITGEGEVATKAYAWGFDYSGAIGNGTGTAFGDVAALTVYTTPQLVKFEMPVEITEVSTGQNFSVVLTKDGKLYGWGSNNWGQLGTSEPENMLGNYRTTPIEVAAAQEEEPDGAEFDAASIPASLNNVERIVLTGEWGTEDLQKLIAPLGNGRGLMGFTYNTALKSVDMTKATFREGTSLSEIFRNCKALESVTFPADESVKNIVSLNNAFLNDEVLSFVNVAGLVNVTDIAQAFQNCKQLASLDLSAWNEVTESEMAFQNAGALSSVILPGKFYIGDRCFGACYALTFIDWSNYEGDTAPVIELSDKYQPFNNIDFVPADKANITIMVPATAYASFSTDSYWKGFNIVEAELPGTYTVDGDDIPSSLSDAVRLKLTGVWNTAKFASLAKALGTASGIAASNSTLVGLDMSAAEIEAGTKLKMSVPGALWGTVDKGVFQKFNVLETVVMPSADQAANFTSFVQAFQDCPLLKSIDLSGCSGLTETNQAFYNCSALESVILPKSLPLNKEMFDRCDNLKTLDWTLFEGTEAPTYSSNCIPTLGKALTVIVPEAAYDSFVESAAWKQFNIVKANTSGIDEVIGADAVEAPRHVFNFSGQYITTLAAGQDASSLPAGLYIIGGKKVLVK